MLCFGVATSRKFGRKRFKRKNAPGHFQAARSHIEEARVLYKETRYGYSIYTAGLAVECLFDAFVLLNEPEHVFDEKHDLNKLMKRSKLLELSKIERKKKLTAAFNFVYTYWDNLYRFASDGEILSSINKKKFKNVKGDLLKFVARSVYENAAEIIKRGEAKWQQYESK